MHLPSRKQVQVKTDPRAVLSAITSETTSSLTALDHEELRIVQGARSGITCIVAVHRTIEGRALGGCRIWSYPDDDSAVADALALSRAMTHKAAAADLPVGGAKGVIALPLAGVEPSRRTAALHDFAELVESLQGRYLSGQDVGASEADMREMARWTRQIGGLPADLGGSGDPSTTTARGVLVAVRAALRHRYGSEEIAGRRIRLVGLGSVGMKVATLLSEAGASLEATDVDPERRAALEELGGRWVDPAHALEGEGDLLCPCALGGSIDERVARTVQHGAIAGAANNQLTAPEVGDLLAERGVLWAPDFVVNAGGLIGIAAEVLGEGADAVASRVGAIADTLATIFARAERHGTSTHAAAVELTAERLTARGVAP